MNTWKWWIVVLVTEDYFTYYDGTHVVKARSAEEAQGKVEQKGWQLIASCYGPFDTKPKGWTVK